MSGSVLGPASEPDAALRTAGCSAGVLAAVDTLLAEATARLGQLPGPTMSAVQHIVASAQAIIRCELESDARQFSPVALSEARAAVVAATYAARHIHDAHTRSQASRT